MEAALRELQMHKIVLLEFAIVQIGDLMTTALAICCHLSLFLPIILCQVDNKVLTSTNLMLAICCHLSLFLPIILCQVLAQT
jgi:hypothetical protein